MCYPLFKVQREISDQYSRQTLNYPLKEHHLYSGT